MSFPVIKNLLAGDTKEISIQLPEIFFFFKENISGRNSWVKYSKMNRCMTQIVFKGDKITYVDSTKTKELGNLLEDI